MNEMTELLGILSEGYLIRQAAVIAGIWISGFLFLQVSVKKRDSVWQYLLAFPVGLSLWGVLGFALLVLGIPYRLGWIAAAYFTVYVLAAFFCKREEKWRLDLRVLPVLLLVLALAAVACSGLFTISITNDSVYYYSVYPQMLVRYGGYRKAFDVFLTDVGQTTAMINCLPFFFGFEETFGIQHFMNFNFAGIFFTAVYETALPGRSKRTAAAAGLAATVFLFVSTPFVISAKWVLANVYFMEFMFLIFYLGGKCGRERGEWEKYKWVLCLLAAMLSMMRMEGGMVACLLILCLSTLSCTNRDLCCFYLLPVALMQLGYYGMLFLKLKADPLYSFLDTGKALLMLALLLGLMLYFLLIRQKRFQSFLKYPEAVILAGLAAGNLLLLAVNGQRYLTNLSCFVRNIFEQNGWGYFGYIFLILLLLIPKKRRRISYPVLFCIGYVLLTVAVCWARSGNLRVGIGDSGNRVMMQVVPFAVYAAAVGMINFLKQDAEGVNERRMEK